MGRFPLKLGFKSRNRKTAIIHFDPSTAAAKVANFDLFRTLKVPSIHYRTNADFFFLSNDPRFIRKFINFTGTISRFGLESFEMAQKADLFSQ